MLTIDVGNVNEALPVALMHIQKKGVLRPSRAGSVLEYPEPVATTYQQPWECVLMNPDRDANPFFHMFEAMWILAGRDDVAIPAMFLPRIAEYSDNGEHFHGAYGYRLRHALGMDQIQAVASMLRKDPTTRRAVMQIWDSEADLATDSKDIPCNDMVMFKVRNGHLQMTVCNRSNDAIWGAYGANAVQFAILHMHVAALAGLPVGSYTQMSDSLHVYTDNAFWRWYLADVSHRKLPPASRPTLQALNVLNTAMREAPKCLLFDLEVFFEKAAEDPGSVAAGKTYKNSILFEEILIPMWFAHKAYREGAYMRGFGMAQQIKAPDWREACSAWIGRRFEKKINGGA